jgi:hypothetical protein
MYIVQPIGDPPRTAGPGLILRLGKEGRHFSAFLNVAPDSLHSRSRNNSLFRSTIPLLHLPKPLSYLIVESLPR